LASRNKTQEIGKTSHQKKHPLTIIQEFKQHLVGGLQIVVVAFRGDVVRAFRNDCQLGQVNVGSNTEPKYGNFVILSLGGDCWKRSGKTKPRKASKANATGSEWRQCTGLKASKIACRQEAFAHRPLAIPLNRRVLNRPLLPRGVYQEYLK